MLGCLEKKNRALMLWAARTLRREADAKQVLQRSDVLGVFRVVRRSAFYPQRVERSQPLMFCRAHLNQALLGRVGVMAASQHGERSESVDVADVARDSTPEKAGAAG